MLDGLLSSGCDVWSSEQYCPIIALIALQSHPLPKYSGATYGMLFLVTWGIIARLCGAIVWNASLLKIFHISLTWNVAHNLSVLKTRRWDGNSSFDRKPESCTCIEHTSLQMRILFVGIRTFAGHHSLSNYFHLLPRFLLVRINEQRNNMDISDIMEKYTEDKLMGMGGASPLFRYLR